MKSAVIESVATPNLSEYATHARRTRDHRERPGLISWGALYAIFLASVGLCAGGSRLVAAVGHSALIEYGVALAILGLLAAWVRRSRLALSSQEVQPRAVQPFSIIHVPFSPQSTRSGQRALAVPSDTEHDIAAVRPATKASHR
jgi:hypothetical protein